MQDGNSTDSAGAPSCCAGLRTGSAPHDIAPGFPRTVVLRDHAYIIPGDMAGGRKTAGPAEPAARMAKGS